MGQSDSITPKALEEYSRSEQERLRTLYTLSERYGQLSVTTCFLLTLFEAHPLTEREAMGLLSVDHEAFRKQLLKLRKSGYLQVSDEHFKEPSTGHMIQRVELGDRGRALLKEIRHPNAQSLKNDLETGVELYKSARKQFPTLYLASLPCVLAIQMHLFSSRQISKLTGRDKKTIFASSRKAHHHGLTDPVGTHNQDTGGPLKLFTVTKKGESFLRLMEQL